MNCALQFEFRPLLQCNGGYREFGEIVFCDVRALVGFISMCVCCVLEDGPSSLYQVRSILATHHWSLPSQRLSRQEPRHLDEAARRRGESVRQVARQ